MPSPMKQQNTPVDATSDNLSTIKLTESTKKTQCKSNNNTSSTKLATQESNTSIPPTSTNSSPAPHTTPFKLTSLPKKDIESYTPNTNAIVKEVTIMTEDPKWQAEQVNYGNMFDNCPLVPRRKCHG